MRPLPPVLNRTFRAGDRLRVGELAEILNALVGALRERTIIAGPGLSAQWTRSGVTLTPRLPVARDWTPAISAAVAPLSASLAALTPYLPQLAALPSAGDLADLSDMLENQTTLPVLGEDGFIYEIPVLGTPVQGDEWYYPQAVLGGDGFYYQIGTFFEPLGGDSYLDSSWVFDADYNARQIFHFTGTEIGDPLWEPIELVDPAGNIYETYALLGGSYIGDNVTEIRRVICSDGFYRDVIVWQNDTPNAVDERIRVEVGGDEVDPILNGLVNIWDVSGGEI